jgi:hypothetical protein
MRIPRDPKGSIVGLATAMIALGLFASWSWHYRHGIAMTSPSATISPALVAGPAEPTSGVGRIVPPRQPRSMDSDFSGQLRCSITPQREAQPAPPVADRATCDPSLVEVPDVLAIAPPPRPASLSSAVPAPRVADEPPADCGPSSLARRTIEPTADIAACWPLPGIVLANLEELRARHVATDWVDRVETGLRDLHRLD